VNFSYWHKIGKGEQVNAVMRWVGPEGADFMMIVDRRAQLYCESNPELFRLLLFVSLARLINFQLVFY
jgi:hypothetical protein